MSVQKDSLPKRFVVVLPNVVPNTLLLEFRSFEAPHLGTVALVEIDCRQDWQETQEAMEVFINTGVLNLKGLVYV
ncbi:hypothetical protein LNQ82_04535 [Conchiformibius steedae DSM 2580]|uniref:Uncharacterized protein n=1 Tax=Conchiformibius steedae DSM 2580 TaxID=1121352 RepID=A0AAE9HXC2_9NEIS|nr:hypothetical protein [Conchiformibius steedae]QMT33757.1 hypothetical protein H3L98_01615 [Conchiformibius steedae]URD68418.1 hypothetical protein LNQ82_04535 [Conchiformibius steedae DSM 2580]